MAFRVATTPSVFVPLGVPGRWRQVFSDHFDEPTLNATRWLVAGGPGDPGNVFDMEHNGEWRPEQVTVADSVLTLTLEDDGGTVYGGAIAGFGKWTVGYGYVEARVRFSGGGWQAFWMQSQTNGVNFDTEVDGLEWDLDERAPWLGGANCIHAVHEKGYGAEHVTTSQDAPSASEDGGWHIIGGLWQPSGYKTYVDGSLVWTPSVTGVGDPALIPAPGQYLIFTMARYQTGTTSGTLEIDYARHWVGEPS